MRRRASLLLVLALVAGSLSAPRAGAETLFGLTDTGELFASTDAGVTWIARSTLPVTDAVSLLAGATSSVLYLASEAGSTYRSNDAGVSWTALSAVPASDVTALIAHPGRLLLFTRSGSVYSSTDAGVTFTGAGAITAPDIVSAASLYGRVFALTATGSVYRSTNDGASWSAIGTLPISNAIGLAAYHGLLYVLTGTGDLARSNDLGVTWSFIATLSQSGMTSLFGAADLMAGIGTGEVAGSANGIAWTWRGAINQLTLRSLGSDQPQPTAVGMPEPASSLRFTVGPSPARGTTSLSLDLDQESSVTVTVHDVAGRVVARPIAAERLPAGPAVRRWMPDLPAQGVYLVRASVGDHVVTRRLIWLGGK